MHCCDYREGRHRCNLPPATTFNGRDLCAGHAAMLQLFALTDKGLALWRDVIREGQLPPGLELRARNHVKLLRSIVKGQSGQSGPHSRF